MSDFIPYGRQCIDEDDIQAVVDVLRGDFLTTGPTVDAFEQSVAGFVGASHAVCFANGTAALHGIMFALGIGPGDEVIVPPMTFAASSNAVLYQKGTPVFCDVDPDTLLIDPGLVEQKITPHTKAVVAVDYTGQPCDYDALKAVADRHGLVLVADACHALGAEYKGRKVGRLAHLTAFSFHPVKHVTTGEGGMVLTEDERLAARLRMFRHHGIDVDARKRAEKGTWYYEMVALGYNYRLTDIQCALGISQMRKLPAWLARRREIAGRYDRAFAGLPGVTPLAVSRDVAHAYHLYVVRIDPSASGIDRDEMFRRLRERGVGASVHYVPVHLHPYYRDVLGTGPGLCPAAEAAYAQILSLPMFPMMRDEDVDRVVDAVEASLPRR